MGAMKKNIKADVRRAARLVIEKYIQQSRGKSLRKSELNSLVKRAEKEVVPAIMQELRNVNTRRAG